MSRRVVLSPSVLLAIGVLVSGMIGCIDRPATPLADLVNSIGMRFVEVPAGSFTMGAPESDTVAEPDERPAHPVTISRSFLLGQYEVTQQQYERVMGTNPSWFAPGGQGRGAVKGLDPRSFPVEGVSWYEANDFCERLSNLPAEIEAGRRYRLPTEAEWEYAGRGKTQTRFPWGNDVDLERANYLGSGWERPRRVGSYAPNAFGLYDMHGNVLEWCSDWHRDDYYRTSPERDPLGPDEPDRDVRVLRGGGWGFTPASSSFRDDILPNRRGAAHGFRVVVEVIGESAPATGTDG